MADEFQIGVCGGNWWNSSRNVLRSSPCYSVTNDMGHFGWPSDLVGMKARSSDESGSASDGCMVVQDIQKPHHQDSACGGGNISMDSTFQMMGIGLSSSTTTDWNQALIRGNGRGEINYHPMLEEDLNSNFNYRQESGGVNCQIQKDWGLKNFSICSDDSSVNGFKPPNQGFSLDQQPINSITSSGESTTTCQGLATSFPITSTSYVYPSTLIQTLFDTDSQPQQSLFDNQSMDYPSNHYGAKLNEFSSSLPKFSSLLMPSLPKQQPASGLHLSNNAPFWNAATAALNDIRGSCFPSTQSQFLSSTFEEKPNFPKRIAKLSTREVRDSGSLVRKNSNEPAFKRPRIETPSPLPTFKVRKEKLGDRITALQQLVSPFGKTDTASVLHEAIEYIELLHNQVGVLGAPYMKIGAIPNQQTSAKPKDTEGPKQDLRSRGLCLVPVSSTFPVAAETSDFWTPTFGGTFK